MRIERSIWTLAERGIASAAVALALLICPAAARAQDKPIWLAVAAPSLVDAIKSLAERRAKEGYEVVVSTEPVDKALAALGRTPRCLLLVGDYQAGQASAPWYVAAREREFYRWREAQPKQYVSDTAWGDLDDDQVPEVAVGRIPARSVEQVKTVVDKILAYETQTPKVEDLSLPIWCGSPGYGPSTDALAGSLLISTIRTHAPPWLQPWVILSIPQHSLCGWPEDQPALFSRRMKKGGVAAVFMGHASEQSLYGMEYQGKVIQYKAELAKAELTAGPPCPPLFILSCDSGDFAGESPCVAESLLFLPGGPVGVVAATCESHPLTNYYSGVSLLRALGGRQRRFGGLWLEAQQRTARYRNAIVESFLRDCEGTLEDPINVGRLRQDQLFLYVLLGDPATRLRLPSKLEAELVLRDGQWHWTAERPDGAKELSVDIRPEMTFLPAGLAEPEQDKSRALFEQANRMFDFQPVPAADGAETWKGVGTGPGALRLVTSSGGKLYVATFDLSDAAAAASTQADKRP